MVKSSQRRQLQPTKWRAPGLACVAIVVSVSITWLKLSADSPVKDQPMATQFQFARMQYPGGIPEYLKNWYTDYPAMDKHLTDRKSTRLNSSHITISYAVFCLKKKKKKIKKKNTITINKTKKTYTQSIK